jgi:hypothetical protein
MKVLENTVLVKVDLYRDLLPKLGLHMNTKKERSGCKENSDYHKQHFK